MADGENQILRPAEFQFNRFRAEKRHVHGTEENPVVLALDIMKAYFHGVKHLRRRVIVVLEENHAKAAELTFKFLRSVPHHHHDVTNAGLTETLNNTFCEAHVSHLHELLKLLHPR